MTDQSEFTPFTCHNCRGSVTLAVGPGRTHEYERGVPPMPVPDDFAIPTCSTCGEIYVLPETLPALQQALKTAYSAWQAEHMKVLIDGFGRRHGATKRQIASVLGVTPSHLSHLLGGSDAASLTLLRFTEVLAAAEAEFRRLLEGRACDVSAFVFDIPKCEVLSIDTGESLYSDASDSEKKKRKRKTGRSSKVATMTYGGFDSVPKVEEQLVGASYAECPRMAM